LTAALQAQADVTGALQNLTQSMHMQMQLAAIDVCTLCSVPDQDVKLFWMLRQGDSSKDSHVAAACNGSCSRLKIM
jgi:hypothetical protein